MRKRNKIAGTLGVFTLVALLAAMLLSFKVAKYYADEFLKQLGISKTTADTKFRNAFLVAGFDSYGLSKAKNIPGSSRAAIAKNAVEYAKKYVAGDEFLKAYQELREKNKPAINPIMTPEQLQKEMIESAKKAVADAEASVKKATPAFKSIFEENVIAAKKSLADAENPNNKQLSNYRKNYASTVKSAEQGNKQLLASWEEKYPAKVTQFIKSRLQLFLNETKDIDYDAQVVEKSGKKVFVNSDYERKGNRWKMGYRAGREAMEAARQQVVLWIAELK